MKEKRLKAYLTVEATFIMPIVIMLTVCVCVYCLYLYNCCVVYQACYISALRGTQISDAKKGDLKETVERYLQELLDNQIYEYANETNVKINMTNIQTDVTTATTNLLDTFDVLSEVIMSGSYSARAMRIDPISLIRLRSVTVVEQNQDEQDDEQVETDNTEDSTE